MNRYLLALIFSINFGVCNTFCFKENIKSKTEEVVKCHFKTMIKPKVYEKPFLSKKEHIGNFICIVLDGKKHIVYYTINYSYSRFGKETVAYGDFTIVSPGKPIYTGSIPLIKSYNDIVINNKLEKIFISEITRGVLVQFETEIEKKLLKKGIQQSKNHMIAEESKITEEDKEKVENNFLKKSITV